MFPGSGLSDEWRTRQFEYTWLRVAAHRYADFWQVTGDALGFATTKLKLRLRPDHRARLMNAYLELKAWPEVIPVLESLKASGLTLALLSNFTPTMLGANIKSAGLSGIFERVLSADDAETFKPDPRAYQLGVDAIRSNGRRFCSSRSRDGMRLVPRCMDIRRTGSIDTAFPPKQWAFGRTAPARR